VRLQRGTVIAWSAGMFLLGIAYGSVANDVEDFVGDNDTLRDIIARTGGSLTDSYLSTSLLMLALIAGGFAVSSALRLRAEETALRAEPILATVWLLVGLAFALFGLLPRAVLATWAALVACFAIGLLDDVLDLPGWATDLSPFEHTPFLPSADFAAGPLVVTAAIAVALTVMGLAGFRARDVAS
jgi:ABC-2 type transport system permease protein